MNTDFYFKALEKKTGKDFIDVLAKNKAFLAGGAILSIVTKKEINDLDIYFRNIDDAKNFYEDCIEVLGYICINETHRSLILVDRHTNNPKPNINMIVFDWFDCPADIFNLFDFTICQAAFDGKRFYFSDEYFRDVCSKSLMYNSKTRFSISSLLRIKKYREKGYQISRNQYLKMCLNASLKKVETFHQLESEIGGVYGIDLEKAFPELKENFSMESFIEKLDDVEIDGKQVDFDHVSSKVKDIGYPTIFRKSSPVLETSDGFISMCDYNPIKISNDDIDDYEVIKYPIYVYKYVKNDLTSFYKPNIVYEIGKLIEDTNPHGFNVLLSKDDHHFYANKTNSVKIELMILQKNDIKKSGNEFSVTKCIPIRIIDEERRNKEKIPVAPKLCKDLFDC